MVLAVAEAGRGITSKKDSRVDFRVRVGYTVPNADLVHPGIDDSEPRNIRLQLNEPGLARASSRREEGTATCARACVCVVTVHNAERAGL